MGNKEQNYFKQKLEISEETLSMAKRKLEHLDIQIEVLKKQFDYNRKIYDDQAKHMQEIVKEMEKRIPMLEKKIAQGYTHVDLKSGKAYKSFEGIHVGRLQEKKERVEANLKEFEKRQAEKVALKKKKRTKLKPEELQIVKAEEIRESLQPEDEIERIAERQKELMDEKIKRYEREIQKLRAEKEAPIIEEIEEPEPVKIEIPEPIKEVLNEDAIQEGQIAIVKEHKEDVDDQLKELESGKVQCPECGKFFTKGGAFASHYKSHFNFSNGDVNGNNNER